MAQLKHTSTQEAETFSLFLKRKVGRNWVLARRSKSIVQRYGDDVVCLSARQYKILEDEYERATGLSAHGLPGEPCDRLKSAAPDLLAALKNTTAALAYVHGEEWETVKNARAAIAKAEGRT